MFLLHSLVLAIPSINKAVALLPSFSFFCDWSRRFHKTAAPSIMVSSEFAGFRKNYITYRNR